MGAAAERERVIHRLAELLTVALSNVHIVRAEVGPKITVAGRAALDDMAVALQQAVTIFPELRKVM